MKQVLNPQPKHKCYISAVSSHRNCYQCQWKPGHELLLTGDGSLHLCSFSFG